MGAVAQQYNILAEQLRKGLGDIADRPAEERKEKMQHELLKAQMPKLRHEQGKYQAKLDEAKTQFNPSNIGLQTSSDKYMFVQKGPDKMKDMFNWGVDQETGGFLNEKNEPLNMTPRNKARMAFLTANLGQPRPWIKGRLEEMDQVLADPGNRTPQEMSRLMEEYKALKTEGANIERFPLKYKKQRMLHLAQLGNELEPEDRGMLASVLKVEQAEYDAMYQAEIDKNKIDPSKWDTIDIVDRDGGVVGRIARPKGTAWTGRTQAEILQHTLMNNGDETFVKNAPGKKTIGDYKAEIVQKQKNYPDMPLEKWERELLHGQDTWEMKTVSKWASDITHPFHGWTAKQVGDELYKVRTMGELAAAEKWGKGAEYMAQGGPQAAMARIEQYKSWNKDDPQTQIKIMGWIDYLEQMYGDPGEAQVEPAPPGPVELNPVVTEPNELYKGLVGGIPEWSKTEQDIGGI